MIEMSIKKLVQYGRTTGLIEAEDEIYARNQILEVLKMSEYEEPGEITDEISLDDEDNKETDAETEKVNEGPLKRMWNVLVQMWKAMVSIFKNR